MSSDPQRPTNDSRERDRERERGSSEFEGGGGGGDGDVGGNDSKRRRLGSQSSRGKKPREQYSCVECFRRKQKCDRRFPCGNCIQRRLPERCLPPAGMQPPPQPSSSSSSFSVPPPNPNTHSFRSPIKQEPSGLPLLYPLTRPPSYIPPQSQTHPQPQPSPGLSPPTPDLAETTARLARLERLLSLQDHTYAEQRLKLAEEAVLRLLEVDEPGVSGGGGGGVEGRGLKPHQQQQHQHQQHLGLGYEGDEKRAQLDLGGMETSSDAEGMGQDENPVELLGDNGYNGATALAALSRAPVLTRIQTSSARNSYDDRSFLSINNHLSGVSSSLDKLLDLTHFQANEIRALFAVLPSRDVCERLVENYWREWDWTRCPLPIGVFPPDWKAWFDVDTFLRAHAKVLAEQGSNMMASLALVLSVLAMGSVSPTLSSTDGHALSSAIFWAAIKALAYCQSPGSNDSKTMWARAILMRYGDLIRNTQMQWYMKSSWIANALDQGFHRDGGGFGLAPEITAERRVIWSHVLHADREWALVLGRPMQVNQYSTLMPTEADLAAWPWDYRQYLLARNELTPILERISTLFQELSLKRTPAAHSNGNFTQTDAHNDKTYQDLLTIDRALDTYMNHLPAHFSLDPTRTNDALERKYPRLKVYRQNIIAQVSFVRITMHRPFMLKALRRRKHPYRYSWQRCVDTAVQDLRARKMWTRTFNPSEQRQMFIGAWALFNSAVVLGLSILISVDMAEVPDPDTYQEYIGHLQECVETLQLDLDQGRDDAVSRRERRIMDSLLARLETCTSAALARPKVSPRMVETPQSGSITPTTRPPIPPPRIPTESLVNVNTNGAAPAIQFDPFLLQPFAPQSGLPVDGTYFDNESFFNWEGLLSEMYCNDPIFP